MRAGARRDQNAWHLLEETLAGNPSGLSSMELVDRLAFYGFREEEGMELLRRLQEEGRLRIDRGRFTLDE